MRIRQIKPSWWLDRDLRTRLDANAREFYVGLWMLADDDGWLDWDVTRIAAELYPYGTNGAGLFDSDPFVKREQDVEAWGAKLVALCPAHPHLVVHPCGHARVPKIIDHQRFGGRPVFTTSRVHARDCAPVRAAAPVGIPTGKGKVGKGKVVVARDGARGVKDPEPEKIDAIIVGIREQLATPRAAPKPVRAKR